MAPFSHVLAITLTLSIPHLTLVILAHGKDNFAKECPPSSCSEEGPVVRYPFRLDSRPPHCGYGNFVLSCSGNNTVLRLPFSGEYNVTSIGYKFPLLGITRYSWSPCPWRNVDVPNLTGSPFYYIDKMSVTWLDCPTVLTSISNDVAGPISCLSSHGRFTYAAITDTPIWNVPANCTKTNTSYAYYASDFQGFDARPQAWLYWRDYDVINCSACEDNGHHCEFNLETRKSFCSVKVKDSHWGLIAGISSGVLSILLLLGFTFHIIHQSNKKRTFIGRLNTS